MRPAKGYPPHTVVTLFSQPKQKLGVAILAATAAMLGLNQGAMADSCAAPNDVSAASSESCSNNETQFENVWQQAQNLDWQTQPSAQVCQGGYFAPSYVAPATFFADVYTGNSTYISANSMDANPDGTSWMQGDVTLIQSNRTVFGRSLSLDSQRNIASLPERAVYRTDNLLVLSNGASFETDDHKGYFNDARFVFHNSQLRGSASTLEQESKTLISVADARVSYCPPGQNDWQLRSERIEFDQDSGWGYAEHVRLEVLDVPVLYLPFLTFPIDDRRQSGFLYPSFSFSDIGGLNINVPYYFNLAENYDDTLTPRLLAEHGVLLENEFRYLSNNSRLKLDTSFLPNDKSTETDRWLLGIDLNTRHDRWSTSLDYNRISDNDYFTDLDSELSVDQESHLDQRLDVNYRADNWLFTSRFHTYQTIDQSTQPYSKLPQLRAYHSSGTGLAPQYFFELTQFDRDTTGLTGQEAITGQRLHANLVVEDTYRRPWGFLKPRASLWLTQYDLENAVSSDSSPTVYAPTMSLDSGLYLDRMLSNGGTHTLEPRLFALYVPETEQNDLPYFDTSELDFSYSYLFRNNRFSGRDRIGDAQQVSLGVTQRYINSDGIEIANLSIGQGYLAQEQTVALTDGDSTFTDRTDIALQAYWRASSSFYVNVDQVLNENDFRPTTTNFRISHRKGLNRRLDVSYRYEKDERDQSTVSFLYPLSPEWTSFGRWQNDWQDNSDVETVLGVEYASCCWAIQFSGRRWLTDADEYNTGFFLKFQLKGLGSAGSSTEFLNDISGFEARSDYYGF